MTEHRLSTAEESGPANRGSVHCRAASAAISRGDVIAASHHIAVAVEVLSQTRSIDLANEIACLRSLLRQMA